MKLVSPLLTECFEKNALVTTVPAKQKQDGRLRFRDTVDSDRGLTPLAFALISEKWRNIASLSSVPTWRSSITSHGDVPTTVQAMKAGAVEFLTKSFSDDVLLSAIQEALEQSRLALGYEAERRARY
jgi:DNA-binding response OmpR family regulator